MILLAVALVVVGCKDRTSEKMQQAQMLRDQARTEFLDSALQRAQQELAQTTRCWKWPRCVISNCSKPSRKTRTASGWNGS